MDNKPVIVDRGVSTYEHSLQRLTERGTAAHNTVCVGHHNSADVWAAFRMGQRPTVKVEKESETEISCVHDGYVTKYGIRHKRQIEIKSASVIIIDTLEELLDRVATMYLHFYPGLVPQKKDIEWVVEEKGIAILFSCSESWLEEYEYCVGINETLTAYRIAARITEDQTNTEIRLNEQINRHNSRGTPQFH